MGTLRSIFYQLPGVVAFLFAALGLAVIYVDELQQRLKKHKVLRWGLAAVVLAIGLAAFIADQLQHDQEQQHLAQEIQQTAASTATSTAAKLAPAVAARVAAQTASQVTKQLNKDYGDVLSGLYKQISDLRGVNETAVRLAYAPAVDLIYAGDVLQVWNKGRTTLTLWGDKYGDGPKDIEKPAQISTGGFYYILTDRLQRRILQELGQNGSARVPLDLYISTADKKKYVVHCELWEIVKDGAITIRTSNHGIERRNW